MPIKIDFVSNVSPFLRGTKDVDKALEDVSDSLDDVVKDGTKGTERLAGSFKELADSAKDSSKEIERSSGDGFSAASDNVAGFKDEAIQNFAEVASSFDGDISQMADGVQGLTGGLASALTPGIGIPVAVIGAIAGAFLQSWAESAEQSKQRVSDMYDDMQASGESFLSAQYLQTGIAAIFGDPDQIKKVQDRVKQLGSDTSTVARAMAGDEGAINKLLDEQARKHQTNLDLIDEQGGSLDDKSVKIDAENVKYEEQTQWLHDLGGEFDTAQSRARDAHTAISDALISTINNAKGATVEVDELGNKLYTLPDGEQVLIEADTQQATTDLSKFKGDVDGATQPVTQKIALSVDRSAFDSFVRGLSSPLSVKVNAQMLSNLSPTTGWRPQV